MTEINKTIFIGIAAFNEPYLKQTIESAISQAEFPERVYFGINYQSSDGCFDDISEFKNARVRYSIIDKPSGFGIDRLIADSFWQCEDYYLQIDAHMLFEKNWDSKIIFTHNKIVSSGFEKPIISTFIPWWSVDADGNILRYEPGSVKCCNVCSYSLGAASREWIEPTRRWESSVCEDSVVEHGTICGHFMFVSSSWLEDVGHDWKSTFIGDETLTALRSYTRGYRMFSVGEPFLWHLNKAENMNTNDWHNMATGSNVSRSSNRFKADQIRQKNIHLGNLFGHSGSPNREELDKYLNFVGFDVAEFYKSMDKILMGGKTIN